MRIKQTCKSCGSEWDVDEKFAGSGSVCPFCKRILKSEESVELTVPQAMRKVIDLKGKNILQNGKIFYSLLADFIPEKVKELRLLKVACYAEVYSDFIDIKAERVAFIAKKAAKQLEDGYMLSEEWAHKAMDWMLEALNINISKWSNEISGRRSERIDVPAQNWQKQQRSQNIKSGQIKSSNEKKVFVWNCAGGCSDSFTLDRDGREVAYRLRLDNNGYMFLIKDNRNVRILGSNEIDRIYLRRATVSREGTFNVVTTKNKYYVVSLGVSTNSYIQDLINVLRKNRVKIIE